MSAIPGDWSLAPLLLFGGASTALAAWAAVKDRLTEAIIPGPRREFYLTDHHRFNPMASLHFCSLRSGYPCGPEYHSNIKPIAVLASVCAFEVRYDLPVVFVPSAQAGARLVERWAFYFAREAVAAVNDLWRASVS